jgi:hypothetical protein
VKPVFQAYFIDIPNNFSGFSRNLGAILIRAKQEAMHMMSNKKKRFTLYNIISSGNICELIICSKFLVFLQLP